MPFSEGVLDTISGIGNTVLDGDVKDVMERNVGLFINCKVRSKKQFSHMFCILTPFFLSRKSSAITFLRASAFRIGPVSSLCTRIWTTLSTPMLGEALSFASSLAWPWWSSRICLLCWQFAAEDVFAARFSPFADHFRALPEYCSPWAWLPTLRDGDLKLSRTITAREALMLLCWDKLVALAWHFGWQWGAQCVPFWLLLSPFGLTRAPDRASK